MHKVVNAPLFLRRFFALANARTAVVSHAVGARLRVMGQDSLAFVARNKVCVLSVKGDTVEAGTEFVVPFDVLKS